MLPHRSHIVVAFLFSDQPIRTAQVAENHHSWLRSAKSIIFIRSAG